MRDIKFRAWNKRRKEMIFFDLYEHQYEYWDYIKETAMQYTGLKDKNGKEIYEGDVIHRHLNVYFAVRWSNDTWEAYPKYDNQGLYLSASQFIECEVIGNIHENPDLLS